MRDATRGGAHPARVPPRGTARARPSATPLARIAAALAILACLGCGGSNDDPRAAASDTGLDGHIALAGRRTAGADQARYRPRSPDASRAGIIVDSVRSVQEELRRFREGLDVVHELRAAAPDSRDALVETLVAALAAADTARLGALLLDRSEFAYLYYPETKFTRPPYRLAPDLLWFLMRQNTENGLARALRRFAGTPLELAGYACADEPERVGENRVWTGCTVDLEMAAGPDRVELFSGIIERGGRHKFLGYSNEL